MAKRREREQPVGVESRHVFLDTEVFRSCAHDLSAKPMQILGRYVEDGVFVLHTTDVTLREARRQIGEAERELANEVDKVARRVERWNRRYRHARDRFPVPESIEPSEGGAAYRQFARIVRHDWNAHVHAAADLRAGPVLDRYFERRAPFDDRGSKEFPDAFALLALEGWCVGAQERVYVVSKDKAVGRAAEASEHLIAVCDLDRLFALVASAEGHRIADAVRGALDGPSHRGALQEALACAIGMVGGVYRGDRYFDGDVLAMEVEDVEAVADVRIMRVDEERVACVADARLAISAEIDHTDLSEAWWDSEDQRYYGAASRVAEVRDVVAAKVFVELERDGEELTFGSAGFLSQDLVVSDDIDDEWPYK